MGTIVRVVAIAKKVTMARNEERQPVLTNYKSNYRSFNLMRIIGRIYKLVHWMISPLLNNIMDQLSMYALILKRRIPNQSRLGLR